MGQTRTRRCRFCEIAQNAQPSVAVAVAFSVAAKAEIERVELKFVAESRTASMAQRICANGESELEYVGFEIIESVEIKVDVDGADRARRCAQSRGVRAALSIVGVDASAECVVVPRCAGN